jgi:hypothetical protein
MYRERVEPRVRIDTDIERTVPEGGDLLVEQLRKARRLRCRDDLDSGYTHEPVYSPGGTPRT